MPRCATDPQRWRSYNGLGILADRRSEYASAEQHYDRAHLLQPDNASVVNNRGYSHYLAGKLLRRGGGPSVRRRSSARPLGTWTNLGKVLAKQGRYEEALESLLKEADTAHAYNALGEVAREVGDLQMARQHFNDAIGAAPRYFPEAQENLAEVDEQLAAATPPAAPMARVAPAGANAPAFGHADPLSVPVGAWLSQGKSRPGSMARRQGTALDSGRATKRAGNVP